MFVGGLVVFRDEVAKQWRRIQTVLRCQSCGHTPTSGGGNDGGARAGGGPAVRLQNVDTRPTFVVWNRAIRNGACAPDIGSHTQSLPEHCSTGPAGEVFAATDVVVTDGSSGGGVLNKFESRGCGGGARTW